MPKPTYTPKQQKTIAAAKALAAKRGHYSKRGGWIADKTGTALAHGWLTYAEAFPA